MVRYRNPLLLKQADPFIHKHTDGYYYFIASAPEFDRINLRRAKTIDGLREARVTTVWRKHEHGALSSLIWAPELHYIRGKWYIYFAAAPTEESHPEHKTFQHRMFVIESSSENPLDGTWEEKGQIQTGWESFSLDATVFEHQNTLYYVWAQKDPGILGNSNLYIAQMDNPWTLKTKQVMLTKPDLEWEMRKIPVNEGPAVLKRNGKIFITYSASATDENYAMGLLKADENSPLLEASSWEKKKEPVFQTSDQNEKFGPGHNSFTVAEDGCTDLLVYHVRHQKTGGGEALNDGGRHACIQPFSWNEQGDPVFGEPVRNEASTSTV
ncbi:glycoside hydrolase family 43 protein [Domibacillus enclensis]|uniref:Alpha-N-arabinofuranosidase n=1 Tax=Domibacillus enclensis TaxID=1017273 RepID=A0A1N6ZZR8_9BACI|nr:glycoside hydrolase family 43 protein [Domibacillus enclensis]OXS75645.1 alpha-N-arabinofuranosidase [Domibacillus enclensis]SIR32259.1 Beta-xylosidase, GH43 family [Domibacillus enclensis]